MRMASIKEDCVLSSASYLAGDCLISGLLRVQRERKREDDVAPLDDAVVVLFEVEPGLHPCGDVARAGRDGL